MRTLTFLVLLAAMGTAQAERRYAVIIGHNQTPDKARQTLRFADDDAARFFELLRPSTDEAHLLTSFDAESQRAFAHLVSAARRPTRAHVLQVLARVRESVHADAKAGRKSTLYFVFAGHGDIDDGEGYVTLADGRFTRSDLRAAVLSGVRADRVHIIVDACKSYYLVAGRGPGGRRVPHHQRFAAPAVTDGVGYILSTSNDEESHEWAAIGGGVFAHEVRSALLGAADLNGDAQIDYEELATFVAVANEGIAHAKYRPSVFIRPPRDARRAPIISLSGKSTLRFEAGDSGRLSVTDPRGVRYADAHKGAGARLDLALLYDGRYAVHWAGSDYAVEAAGGPLSFADLQPVAAATPRGDGDHAFQQLFTQPLQPAVLRGYRLARDASPDVATAVDAKPAPAWLAPTLAAVGTMAAGVGVGLHLAAVDEFDQAESGPQVDLRDHESQGTAYAYGAAGAYVVATSALVAAAWVFFTSD